MNVEIPMPVPSVANLREHWAAKAKRTRAQRRLVAMVLRSHLRSHRLTILLPCTVKVTRVAPRPLDSHDNLRASCKAAVDGVSDVLGVNDNDPAVTWIYDQARGKPKYQALRFQFITSCCEAY